MLAQMQPARSPRTGDRHEIVAICGVDVVEVAVSALAIEAAGADGEPHQWVRMIPMGVFGGQRDSRGPWVLDGPEHAAQVVAASQARAAGQDPVVDYDHQSEVALDPDKRTPAPASGWMKELQARDDGIYARVEWTEPAKARMKAKEYRYISPVFGHEKTASNGQHMRVTRLLRAGLTNNPCLPELAAVAAQTPHPDPGADMDFKKIAAALGLAETATETQIIAACATVRSEVGKVAVAAGLKADAKVDEVVTALGALKTAGAVDPTKYVPRETYDALSTRVTRLETDTVEEKAVAAVDGAIAGGKIPPAQRDWYLGHARRDLADFQTFVAAAPAILTPGRLALGGGKPAGEVTADADELAVAASMGLTKEAYLEAKKANAQ